MCILGDILEGILVGKVAIATKPSEYDFKNIWSIRHINTLPRELLLCIFRFLQHSELKQVVLVCKHWRDVGEDPVLWKKFKFVVASKNICYLDTYLNSRRLQCLKSLEINAYDKGTTDLNSEAVGTILKSTVNKLILKNCDLTKLSEADIKCFVNKIKSLSLWQSDLEKTQISFLFDCLQESSSKGLVELDIGYSYLS